MVSIDRKIPFHLRLKTYPTLGAFAVIALLNGCMPAGQSKSQTTVTSAQAFSEALDICYTGRADFSDLPALLKSKGFTLKPAKGNIAAFVDMIGAGQRFGQRWTVAIDVNDGKDLLNDLPTFTLNGKTYTQHLVECEVDFPNPEKGLRELFDAANAHPNLVVKAPKGFQGIMQQRYISGNVTALPKSHKYDYFSFKIVNGTLRMVIRRYR